MIVATVLQVDNGSVGFQDHETDDLVHLADSAEEFVSGCTNPPEIEFDQSKVKSVCIDPAFAKSLGRNIPKNVWLKKPEGPK